MLQQNRDLGLPSHKHLKHAPPASNTPQGLHHFTALNHTKHPTIVYTSPRLNGVFAVFLATSLNSLCSKIWMFLMSARHHNCDLARPPYLGAHGCSFIGLAASGLVAQLRPLKMCPLYRKVSKAMRRKMVNTSTSFQVRHLIIIFANAAAIQGKLKRADGPRPSQEIFTIWGQHSEDVAKTY